LKYLFVAERDWANIGYLLARSLQSIGEDAKAVCFQPHSFYNQGAELIAEEPYLILTDEAEVIVAMHSTFRVCDYKKLWVFHGGALYRRNSVQVNRAFNPIIEGSLIQTWNLLNLGARNPHCVLPPIDLSIEPDYTYYGKLFAHYPHKALMKGTDIILKVVKELSAKFSWSDKLVPHDINMNRMAACDVYIEQMWGREWGLTALEAAALGKIVITNFQGLEDYRKQYGECGLVVANNEDELRQEVTEIMNWTPEQILEKKKATREWVETYHSFEAVGRRLKEILND
jgi:hypothetical protein